VEITQKVAVVLTPAMAVPADFTGPTTNYLHQGVLTNTQPLFYRVKLLR
jgi:hypothetical protein